MILIRLPFSINALIRTLVQSMDYSWLTLLTHTLLQAIVSA